MKKHHPGPILILMLALAVAVAPPLSAQAPTALDDYVKEPDPAYRYNLVKTIVGPTNTAYVIELISQSWLTTAEINQPVWRHWLTIVKPAKVKSRIGLMIVAGGDNGKPMPQRANPLLGMIAQATETVVAEIQQVPNQPLVFAEESQERKEDAMIAYTWDKHLRNGDDKWPARLPMTKSVVKAMDTVSAFCKDLPENLEVDQFVVAGASKRGWTAWTTAAVDPRVVAVVPLVIDLLNLEPSFQHHFQAYGFWAPAIHDYQEMGIMKWMATPEFARLARLVDPYCYRDRLTMPKFMVNATGDQFFLPDSWQFYFDDLKGENYLRYVPNTDHSLKNSDAPQSLIAFHAAVAAGSELPKYDWRIDRDGTIRVKAATPPKAVKLWQATNSEARDFRLEKIGSVWSATDLPTTASGEYAALVPPPQQGWTAYFLELTFESGVAGTPFKFTTGVRVTPERLPFPLPGETNRQ
jgi:PhoPQ-activated pathogenicity-related protein